MRRIFRGKIHIASFLIFITTPPALADCDSSLAQARAMAREIAVTITAPVSPRAGVPIKIMWNKRISIRDLRSQIPVYIVFTAPSEVRFAGTGFIALTAGAAGPNKLNYAMNQSRALVAMHRATDTANSGEFTITPYRAGTQNFGWAIVAAGVCGEQVLAQGAKIASVAPGASELVVQDRFTTEQPKQRIRSLTGAYDLLIYDGRFEVHVFAFFARPERPSEFDSISQYTRDGEIWGVNADILRQGEHGSKSTLVTLPMEDLFITSLDLYLEFMRSVAKNPLPIQVEAGIEGIKGRLVAHNGYIIGDSGVMHLDRVTHRGI